MLGICSNKFEDANLIQADMKSVLIFIKIIFEK